MGGAFGCYRHIVHKGKHATATSLIERRAKTMTPEPAKTIADVESKLTQWRGNLRKLREGRQEQDVSMLGNNDLMITVLVNMMPEIIFDYLFSF